MTSIASRADIGTIVNITIHGRTTKVMIVDYAKRHPSSEYQVKTCDDRIAVEHRTPFWVPANQTSPVPTPTPAKRVDHLDRVTRMAAPFLSDDDE